jgi:hypothetical protein
MKKIKKYLWSIIFFLYCFLWLWLITTKAIQMYKCPKMNSTELLLNTDNSFLLKFEECR